MRSKWMQKRARWFAVLAVVCLVPFLTVSGCGGGGGGALPGTGGGQKTAVVTGVVRDAVGKPVQGATVEAYDPAGKLLDTARSDADGEFKLTLPVGVAVMITASAAGYAIGYASLTPVEGYNSPITITLSSAPLTPPPPPTFPE
ncbi:MAG: hypothetical protein GDYSWBUE_001291 [Candidatus Fervidibacterota bacterium]